MSAPGWLRSVAELSGIVGLCGLGGFLFLFLFILFMIGKIMRKVIPVIAALYRVFIAWQALSPALSARHVLYPPRGSVRSVL